MADPYTPVPPFSAHEDCLLDAAGKLIATVQSSVLTDDGAGEQEVDSFQVAEALADAMNIRHRRTTGGADRDGLPQ